MGDQSRSPKGNRPPKSPTIKVSPIQKKVARIRKVGHTKSRPYKKCRPYKKSPSQVAHQSRPYKSLSKQVAHTSRSYKVARPNAKKFISTSRSSTPCAAFVSAAKPVYLLSPSPLFSSLLFFFFFRRTLCLSVCLSVCHLSPPFVANSHPPDPGSSISVL